MNDVNEESVEMSHLEDAREHFPEGGVTTEGGEPEGVEKEGEEAGVVDPSKELLESIGFREKGDGESLEVKPETGKAGEDGDLNPPPEDSPNRAHWDELKTRKNEAVARVKELEAQLAERGDEPTTESLRARVKELEGENARFSSRLKELDFQSHPEYLRKFEEPIAEAKLELGELAKSEDVEVNVEALFTLKGKEFAAKVTEIMDQLTRFNGDEFSRVARNAQKVMQERDAVSAESEKFTQEANEQLQAQTREVFDRVGEKYNAAFQPLELPADADDSVKSQVAGYNSALAETAQVAEQIAFGSLDSEQLARIAHEAAQYRFLVARGMPQLAQNAGAKIAELQAELDAIKGAGPSYAPGGGGGEPQGVEEMGHMEAARVAFGR